MNLYLLTYTDDEGCNLDTAIQAPTPEHAVSNWRERWGHWSIGDEDLQNRFKGDILNSGDHTNPADSLHIFQIELTPGAAGVLGWHNPTPAGCLKLVGYLNP
ncbi:hypothetical protein PXK56_18425 [Phaeobacter gallaeciensis]|uniref:hypothetical protein n=1 Tax=Phaeobacter gallaeciensis TaxID=60890 RepID=UPI0023803D49|nr:hypothetical protein [Phaeobacter gallaeciensis]MDE4297164.1 hypothetical protein [Phaeobacter gallaeciensis]